MGYLAGSRNTGAAEATDSTGSAPSSTATTHSSALFFTSPGSCTYKFNSQMENRMEEEMEHEMETGVLYGI